MGAFYNLSIQHGHNSSPCGTAMACDPLFLDTHVHEGEINCPRTRELKNYNDRHRAWIAYLHLMAEQAEPLG